MSDDTVKLFDFPPPPRYTCVTAECRWFPYPPPTADWGDVFAVGLVVWPSEQKYRRFTRYTRQYARRKPRVRKPMLDRRRPKLRCR